MIEAFSLATAHVFQDALASQARLRFRVFVQQRGLPIPILMDGRELLEGKPIAALRRIGIFRRIVEPRSAAASPPVKRSLVGDISVAPNGIVFAAKLRGQRTAAFTSEGKPIGAPLNVSGDPAWLALGDRLVVLPKIKDNDPARVVKLWNPLGPDEVVTSPVLSSPARFARAHPSQPWMALGLDNGTVAVWDVSKNEIKKQWKAGSGSLIHVEWSPDGRLTGVLATSCMGLRCRENDRFD